MNRNLFLIGAILLTGCGLSDTKFATQYAEEYCTLYETCGLLDYFGGDYATCVSTLEATALAAVQADSCTYDGGAAKDCIKEFKDINATGTCDGSSSTTGQSACELVCGTTTGDTGM